VSSGICDDACHSHCVVLKRKRCYLLGAQSGPDVQTGEEGGSRIKVAALWGVGRDGWGYQVEKGGWLCRRLQSGQGAGGFLGISNGERHGWSAREASRTSG